MMRGWNSKEAIDPYMVDWSTITASNLPFRFQQAPGAKLTGALQIQYAEFRCYLSARYAEP